MSRHKPRTVSPNLESTTTVLSNSLIALLQRELRQRSAETTLPVRHQVIEKPDAVTTQALTRWIWTRAGNPPPDTPEIRVQRVLVRYEESVHVRAIKGLRALFPEAWTPGHRRFLSTFAISVCDDALQMTSDTDQEALLLERAWRGLTYGPALHGVMPSPRETMIEIHYENNIPLPFTRVKTFLEEGLQLPHRVYMDMSEFSLIRIDTEDDAIMADGDLDRLHSLFRTRYAALLEKMTYDLLYLMIGLLFRSARDITVVKALWPNVGLALVAEDEPRWEALRNAPAPQHPARSPRYRELLKIMPLEDWRSLTAHWDTLLVSQKLSTMLT